MWENLFNNRENKIYCKYLLLNKWSKQIYFFVFIFFIFLFEFINFLQNLLAFCLFYGNLPNHYKSRGAIIISIFSEWITKKKKERNSCRNQIKVVLFGWWRARKGRHCHSFSD